MPSSNPRKVHVSELALSTAYRIEALIRVLENKGVLNREEVLEEIKQITQEQQQTSRPS